MNCYSRQETGDGWIRIRVESKAALLTVAYAVLYCLVILPQACSGEPPRDTPATTTTGLQIKYVKEFSTALRQANTLKKIDGLFKATKEKWPLATATTRVRFARLACDWFGHGNLGGKKQRHTLIDKLVQSALKEQQKVTFSDTKLEDQLHLATTYLNLTDARAIVPQGRKWPRARSKNVTIWLRLLGDLRGAIDPAWNPNKQENMPNEFGRKLALMKAVGVPNPAPESIKDPKLRKEYAAHLAANASIRDNNDWQRGLRELEVKYAKVIENYVVAVYSRPPKKRAELKRLLKAIDKDARERILKAIATREKL